MKPPQSFDSIDGSDIGSAVKLLRTVGRVLISTDIEDILSSTPPEGFRVSRRLAHLAADTTPMFEVIYHLIHAEHLVGQTIVLLQATSSLRNDGDMLDAIEIYAEGEH